MSRIHIYLFIQKNMTPFLSYALVGIVNSAIHWSVFALAMIILDDQGICNLIAFCVAVTFSFFMNAKFTFNTRPTGLRYTLFLSFMGLISYLFGAAGQALGWPKLVTLAGFSAISLILGFFFSRYVVFFRRTL